MGNHQRSDQLNNMFNANDAGQADKDNVNISEDNNNNNLTNSNNVVKMESDVNLNDNKDESDFLDNIDKTIENNAENKTIIDEDAKEKRKQAYEEKRKLLLEQNK